MSTVNWKWSLILGLVVGSVLAVWRLGIRLGLDLRGGIHLVIQVETDDAVRAALDNSVNELREQLTRRKVPFKSVERLLDSSRGEYAVAVDLEPEDDGERVAKVVGDVLRDYNRTSRGNRVVAVLPGSQVEAIRDTTVEQALNTISERVNATGVAEPIIQRQGLQGDRVLVQLPGVEDPEHVKRLIGRVAHLELKLVDSGPHITRESALESYGRRDDLVGGTGLPPGLEVVEGSGEGGEATYFVLHQVPVVTGADLARAMPDRDELGQPAVAFQLNSQGSRRFGDFTGKNVGRLLAIVLDDRVKSAPEIRSRISDRGQISGSFTLQEARDLALVLRAGSLPAKIQYLEERTVGPFLGRDSIRKGTAAGLVGLALIIVFMLIYYRLAGLNAVVALLLNCVLLMGAVALLRATLTLPGIAGVILTLGMAVDANVLVFEAIREFLRGGSAPRRAIEDGFSRAFTTIVDSNLTTIAAATALWMLGSGPVRGFGVTLVMGLLISMFTAYYVSKTIFETFILSREWKPGDTLSI